MAGIPKKITGGEANAIMGRTIFANENKCVTYTALTSNGFTVKGTYGDSELVDRASVIPGICVNVHLNVDIYQKVLASKVGEYFLYTISIAASNSEEFRGAVDFNSLMCSVTYQSNTNEYHKYYTGETGFDLIVPYNNNTDTIDITISRVKPIASQYAFGNQVDSLIQVGADPTTDKYSGVFQSTWTASIPKNKFIQYADISSTKRTVINITMHACETIRYISGRYQGDGD